MARLRLLAPGRAGSNAHHDVQAAPRAAVNGPFDHVIIDIYYHSAAAPAVWGGAGDGKRSEISLL